MTDQPGLKLFPFGLNKKNQPLMGQLNSLTYGITQTNVNSYFTVDQRYPYSSVTFDHPFVLSTAFNQPLYNLSRVSSSI